MVSHLESYSKPVTKWDQTLEVYKPPPAPLGQLTAIRVPLTNSRYHVSGSLRSSSFGPHVCSEMQGMLSSSEMMVAS